MAVSKTTFTDRLKKINSGKTTSWTVPGEGLATRRDEASFLRKANVKMAKRSTQNRRGPFRYLLAILVGGISVIVGRWLDFTFLDTFMGFASDRGVDAASVLDALPTSLALAVLISIVAMFILGLRSKQTVPLQAAGFVGAFLFEADLVALAPDVYARFYNPAWVADMIEKATLLTT